MSQKVLGLPIIPYDEAVVLQVCHCRTEFSPTWRDFKRAGSDRRYISSLLLGTLLFKAWLIVHMLLNMHHDHLPHILDTLNSKILLFSITLLVSGFFQWLRSSTCPYQEAAARSPQRPDTDSGRTSDTIRTREPPAHPGHYSPAFNLVSATCTVCAFFRLFVSYDVIISCVSHWRAGTDLPQADSVIVFLFLAERVIVPLLVALMDITMTLWIMLRTNLVYPRHHAKL